MDLTLFDGPDRTVEAETARILSVGRLVGKKGFAQALDAVAAVVQRGRTIQYRIIGDGPLRPALTRQVHSRGLAHHVELLGWQNQASVREQLARTDIFLAPSVTMPDGNTEGLPTVIKEAMACGLPVVATDHGGICELVADGVSGRLVPEYDVPSLSEALVQMIDQPQLRIEMGRAGRNIVARHYNDEPLNDELAAIIRTLAHHHDGRSSSS